MPIRFCGHCGDELGGDPHPSCMGSLRLEPPRFCARCRRRMVVQVSPTGWAARCSTHGQTEGGEQDHTAALMETA